MMLVYLNLALLDSPLEQFTNTFCFCKEPTTFWLGLPRYISTVLLQIILAMVVFSFINFMLPLNKKIYTSSIGAFFVSYFIFLKGLAKSNLNFYTFGVLVFTIFNSILFFNLMGLLPFTSTLFAQITATLTLSFFAYGTMLVNYIAKRKLRAIEIFMPSGTPLFIAPLLIIIEIISVFSRIISLSVRLFANLTAGHILLKILSTFFLALVIQLSNVFLFGASILLLLVILLVTGLETLIALLQTYVYITLLLLYMHDLEELH